MATSSCWFNKLIKSSGKHIFDVLWNTKAPSHVEETIKKIFQGDAAPCTVLYETNIYQQEGLKWFSDTAFSQALLVLSL